ncbi:MAG: FAD-dependent oxidoreductase [Candidatus Atabeyarchaeum deiterrae]
METKEQVTIKKTLEEILGTEKLRYCYECGICTASCSISEMFGKDYNPRTLLERVATSPEKALASDELWLCGWCYRCYERCPQALKLPEIFLLMRTMAAKQGQMQPFENALHKIVETVPLPLVALSVCFHPERAGLDKQAVLDKAERMRKENLKTGKATKTHSSRQKVAVLGSGPAGLTVAYELSLKGYDVTVLESLREPGGMLTKCIPDTRLPRQVLAKEIQLLKDLGVSFKTATTVGKDLSFEDLSKKGYKAIFIGVGAHRGTRLKIEGGDLGGVIHALDFLWNVNSGERMEIGKNVVVIGGGNIAVDAARTALKHGANEVTILYRRSRDEMPAIPWEVKEAEEEGVKIEFLTSPGKILGEQGRVTAIECIRMQLGELDETGRRASIPLEGSDFTRKSDMIILAIGETPDLAFLPKRIDVNDDGTLQVDPITMETSIRGVFAGGDVVTGPATVIEAIQAGKNAAESIENYLTSLEG